MKCIGICENCIQVLCWGSIYMRLALLVTGPFPDRGVWSVELPATGPNTGPHEITASLHGQDTSITLKDVLFGDVWVCSGQSNMQFTVAMVSNGASCVWLTTAHNSVDTGFHWMHVHVHVLSNQKPRIPSFSKIIIYQND